MENNFPIIGPNCLGVYSAPFINTFFFPDERFVEPLAGNVGLACQSGGVLVDLLIKFTQEQLGISKAISLGNEASVDCIEVLRYFRDDEKTSVIGLYIEGFAEMRGRDLVNELKKIEKPVVILKAGKTPASLDAISSHTAALAGDYTIFSDVLKATDAVEIESAAEFLSACGALSCHGKRTIENISIITMSGGHGVTASDHCHRAGINIIPIPPDDSAALREMMSANVQNISSFTNPIDITGSAVDDDYFKAVKFALERDYIDAILLMFLPFIPAISSSLTARLTDLASKFDKPAVCYIPYMPKFDVFIEGFRSNGIPVSHTIDGSVDMLKAIRKKR